MESIRKLGPNIISFVLVSGHRKCWHMVGVYIPPDNNTVLERVVQAFQDMPEGVQPLLLGDLNMDLCNLWDTPGHEIVAELATLGLDDLLLHYRQWVSF